MDTLFQRYLDRDVFDPLFMFTGDKKKRKFGYDSLEPAIYTGMENRFETLLNIFSDADIVQFKGSFGPLVCEAAKAAHVPVLLESLHVIEAGQVYPDIDTTICVSETVKKEQPYPEKSVVIYNGIDLNDFSFRLEAKKPEDKIIILQASNRAKSRFHLDEIADRLLAIDPRIELWLAGIGQEGDSSDRVKYFGLTNDIAQLYKKADLLVLFSEKEAFGLVAPEAMASGCLPVVSEEMGPGEIVRHEKTGWTAPQDDIGAVISTIQKAVSLRGSGQWETMRKAARKDVELRFSGRVCVKQHEQLFIDLIANKGARKSPGPLFAKAPPEVDVDESVALFHDNRWDMIPGSINKMISNDLPFTISQCARAAAMLARQVTAREMPGLADGIYNKIHRSGFMTADWLKDWLNVTSDPQISNLIINELQKNNPSDPETVLAAAELRLNEGSINGAIDILRNGIETNPDSKELQEVYQLLKSKFKDNPLQ